MYVLIRLVGIGLNKTCERRCTSGHCVFSGRWSESFTQEPCFSTNSQVQYGFAVNRLVVYSVLLRSCHRKGRDH